MSRNYLFLIFLLFSLPMWSQEDISIGKKYSIYSGTLQEERNYWIYLPEDYDLNKEQSYQVIYLLDGESFFHALVGITKTIVLGKGKNFAPSIVVGVLSTDRTRDLTPTPATAGRDGKPGFFSSPQGGGSEKFNYFLTKELRPFIDSVYRTSGENVLIGHSYAGLFTIDTFLRHTEQFNKYIAIDPSLWWDQGRLMNEASSMILHKDFQYKSLYIGFASIKREGRNDINLNQAHTLLTEILPQAKNLHFFSKLFPEENHGSVVIPGIYNGLKQLYK